MFLHLAQKSYKSIWPSYIRTEMILDVSKLGNVGKEWRKYAL